MNTVGVDNKVSLQVRVCSSHDGVHHSFAATRVAVNHGCVARPVPKSRFCLAHLPQSDAHGVRTCPEGHGLAQEPNDGLQRATPCDVCNGARHAEEMYSCELGCFFDVCSACYHGIQPVAAAPHVCRAEAGCNIIDIDPEWDSCGLAKPAAPSGKARATGGVTSCTLACGTVCNIAICAGSESATQIFGLLGEVRLLRPVDFVIYDNACMLHRFVANVTRRFPSGVGRQLATEAYYVLDRFHRQNHVACLNPTHCLYLPSVDIDRHPRLQTLNTSQNEQWNGWLDKFAHVVRTMRFETLDMYLLLISELWNSEIVPARAPSVGARALPKAPIFKRRRT